MGLPEKWEGLKFYSMLILTDSQAPFSETLKFSLVDPGANLIVLYLDSSCIQCKIWQTAICNEALQSEKVLTYVNSTRTSLSAYTVRS